MAKKKNEIAEKRKFMKRSGGDQALKNPFGAGKPSKGGSKKAPAKKAPQKSRQQRIDEALGKKRKK